MRTHFGKSLLLLILLLNASGQVLAQNAVKVTNGKHIMIDGKCEPNEWADAAALPASENYRLLFKKSADYVYICVASAKAANLMIDLFFSPTETKFYTLHASAKLGERVLQNGKWPQFTTDWDWWKIEGWTANTLRVKSFNGPPFLPGNAIEFQINRQHFEGKEWRVMFEFIADGSWTFPKNADNLKRDTWIKLDLSQ